MSNLVLPTFTIGMVVITPANNVPHLTEDRKYIILDIDKDWVKIEDDTEEARYYQSHLFIEADIYYNMLLWLTLMRCLDMNPKDL